MTDSEGNEIGKLFVGGISQTTNNASLRVYFSQFGELEDAVVMMDSKTGRSRGFGYVKYCDPESAKVALAAKPHRLDGKEIDAKQCNVNMRGRNRRSLKVFVGGVGPEQNVTSITAFFEKFGHVTDVNLMMDPNKQRHRGFAFVGFDDEGAVNRLINMHFLTMGSRQVEIKAMEPPNFGKKGTNLLARHGFEPSEPRGENGRATRKTGSLHLKNTQTSSHQKYSNVNIQYNPCMDPNAYGLITGHGFSDQHQSYVGGFGEETGGQMQPGRLMNDQFQSGVYSVSGKMNPMPIIFANSFFAMTPTMYGGCQPLNPATAYPYPILQPQILHPGLLPGNEEFWTHGIFQQQQQQMLLAPQTTGGQAKPSSASQTSPLTSRCRQQFCGGVDSNRGNRLLHGDNQTLAGAPATIQPHRPPLSGSLNPLDQNLGIWCVPSAHFSKTWVSGADSEQKPLSSLLHNQNDSSASKQQPSSDLSEAESKQETILAKPSGDNFDRDDNVSDTHDGGLTVMKDETEVVTLEQVKNELSTTNAQQSSSNSWMMQRFQAPPSTWTFRPPYWGDVQLPPGGFGLSPGFILQPHSPTTWNTPPPSAASFDPTAMEHALGGFGYGFPGLPAHASPEQQTFQEDEPSGEPPPSILSGGFPTSSTSLSSSLQQPPPPSSTGSQRRQPSDSLEVPSLVGLHQKSAASGCRQCDNVGDCWITQPRFPSGTNEAGKKSAAGDLNKGVSRGGGGGLLSGERESVAAGDSHQHRPHHHYRNF
ncbi:unnamed protein product [Mesocestoides corti]|uniref:RRM domain-containing protein n=1 Tax=Mesocestoides corti TaxID=53468 RepID=A0A0R3UQ17_MESCO|nr:unnamed protein product [Mesocestoides corti]